LPVGIREFLERMDDLDSCVAHQDIDAAVGAYHGGDAVVDAVFVGHVHGDADCLAAAAGDLLRRAVRGVTVQVGDRDLRAFTRERHRDFLADAARGTGDDGNLVLKLHPISFAARESWTPVPRLDVRSERMCTTT